MTTTEHATRRPLHRTESAAEPVVPASERLDLLPLAATDTDRPDELETLCVGEAR